MKKQLANIIASAIKKAFEFETSTEDILNLLESPKDEKMGDIAFPCFSLAKSLKKAPPLIAQEIEKKLNIANHSDINDCKVVGPYINFIFNKANIAKDIIPQILNGSFTAPRPRSGLKTMIEYSQPNTHKGFHVGHTRNVSLGDSLVRLIEWSGDEVVAANYIGDVGTHIAKCLWIYLSGKYKFDEYKNKMSRGEFLGMLYAEADKKMDFFSLTKAPHPNVITVKVLDLQDHPKNKSWIVAVVDTSIEKKTVVTGVKGFKVGDIVPYAKIGTRINGKRIEETDKEGVISEGMLCSPQEISLSEVNDKIFIFPENTPLGIEAADYFQIDKSITSAAKEIVKREEEVSLILQKLEKGDAEITKTWQETKDWSMQDFYEIYSWLNARFDHYFFESEVAKPGKDLVFEYLKKGVFKKDQGAIGVDLSLYKLPFFLVLKSDGTGLYSTKDLALAELKFKEFKIDRSIYVVDTGQSLHFQQVFKTLELMGYEQAKKSYHLPYGMVVLPDGKMSSRKGNVILLSQLKKQLADQIYKDFLKSYDGLWPQEEIDEAIRKISIATIKYGMLNQDNNKNITFDLKEWTARTGNTGPYLMYAYARTRSILREVEAKFGKVDTANLNKINWSLLNHETEEKVLNKLQSFPQVVEKAASIYQPQQICIYTYELCKDFSRMYDHCSVLHAETEELRTSRALLVDACGRVIQKGLELLGISTLERM